MIIPVRCFTCGKVLASMWKYYEEEVKKLEEEKSNEAQDAHFEGVSKKEILDKLGLTKICCRRHMLTHVDMIDII